LPAGPALEQRPVHVAGAAPHRGTGEDVLADCMVEEAGRGEDRDATRFDLLRRGDALGTTEVVDVAVGVDQAGDGTLTAMLAVEAQCRGGSLGRDQRVDHDDSLFPLDHVHVREIETAQLVEAGRQLEKTGDPSQLALPPEIRVSGVRWFAVEEVVRAQIPDSAALRVLDHGWLEGRDQTATCLFEVALAHLSFNRRPRGVAARGGKHHRAARAALPVGRRHARDRSARSAPTVRAAS
jgi:hypothetical protein